MNRFLWQISAALIALLGCRSERSGADAAIPIDAPDVSAPHRVGAYQQYVPPKLVSADGGPDGSVLTNCAGVGCWKNSTGGGGAVSSVSGNSTITCSPTTGSVLCGANSATGSAAGILKLAGDLGGTSTSPSVGSLGGGEIAVGSSTGTLTAVSGATAFGLTMATPSSDVAPENITIQGASAYSGAVTNTTAGNLYFFAGSGVSSGFNGTLAFGVPSGTSGEFQFGTISGSSVVSPQIAFFPGTSNEVSYAVSTGNAVNTFELGFTTSNTTPVTVSFPTTFNSAAFIDVYVEAKVSGSSTHVMQKFTGGVVNTAGTCTVSSTGGSFSPTTSPVGTGTWATTPYSVALSSCSVQVTFTGTTSTTWNGVATLQNAHGGGA